MIARRFCSLCAKDSLLSRPIKAKRTGSPTSTKLKLGPHRDSISSASKRNLSNSEVRKKRNVLFDEEKDRQLALVKRVEKIQVEYRGQPENCSLLMNKNLSTPYNCSMHINEFVTKRSILALINGQPWDMHRPLEEDCELEFLHMLDEECELQNKVFWRTSAFLLGHLLETSFKEQYYVELCSFPKPQVEKGSFAYDVDLKLPNWSPTERELLALSLELSPLISKDCHFERLVVSESVAMEMFEDNRFKMDQIPAIAGSSEEAGKVTIYRVGDHIDISRGPLISTTGQIGRFAITTVHDIESRRYGKLKRFQGLSMPRDIQMHYWTWELLQKYAKIPNKSFIPGSDVQRRKQEENEAPVQQEAAV